MKQRNSENISSKKIQCLDYTIANNENVVKISEKLISQNMEAYRKMANFPKKANQNPWLKLEEKAVEAYEQSLNGTPYTPFIEAPYRVDMREISNYLRQKCCSFDELTDEEKAKFVNGDLSDFREYLKKHNLHSNF